MDDSTGVQAIGALAEVSAELLIMRHNDPGITSRNPKNHSDESAFFERWHWLDAEVPFETNCLGCTVDLAADTTGAPLFGL